MKKRIYFKKAESALVGQVVMIILTIILFLMIIYYVYDSSKSVVFVEKTYAKQIALLIDSSRPGMNISVDFSEGFDLAEKNKISLNNLVRYSDNKIIVQLGKRPGYSMSVFTDYNIEINHDEKNKILLLIVK